MNATLQRDQAAELAKTNPSKALEKARKIQDPWFRAQALSWVARFHDDNPMGVADEAAKAASECDDDYKRTAVRAWEIAALAERTFVSEARAALKTALGQSRSITPLSSRSEALMLLLQAAFRISERDARMIGDELEVSCGRDAHWRCKRAVRDAKNLFARDLEARPFFW
jgi:hypothetical protein